MDAIAKVRERLQAYPDAVVEEAPSSITVKPSTSDGFPVGLVVSGSAFTVHCEGWHEQFSDEDEAIRCFGFCLSTACRLAVTYRGQTPVSWTLESLDNDEWRPTSVTGLLLVPFWRPKRTVYRSNGLLTPTKSAAQQAALTNPRD